MKKFKEKQVVEKEIVSVTCDRCGHELDDKELRYGKYHTIKYTGGYWSDWPGDLDTVIADLCESCLKELIEDFAEVGYYRNMKDK